MTPLDPAGPSAVNTPPRRNGLAWRFGRLIMRRDPGSTLQRNGRRYLRDIYAASREVGITPFLMWGTLLGCIRDNALMQHDYDLDIGLRAGDYARKDALIAAMRRRGYRASWNRKYKIRFVHPHHRLHIDVDVFYPWEDKVICAVEEEGGGFCAEIFAADMFDRLREVEFLGGVRVLVPDPPEPVLAAIYGEWRLPDPTYQSHSGPLNRLEAAPNAVIPPLRLGLRPGY